MRWTSVLLWALSVTVIVLSMFYAARVASGPVTESANRIEWMIENDRRSLRWTGDLTSPVWVMTKMIHTIATSVHNADNSITAVVTTTGAPGQPYAEVQ